jgi:hypothetical protein
VVIVDILPGTLGVRLFEKRGAASACFIANLVAAAAEQRCDLLQRPEDQINCGQPLLAIDEFPLARTTAADDYRLQAIEVRRIGPARRQLERGQIVQQRLNLSRRPAIATLVGWTKNLSFRR